MRSFLNGLEKVQAVEWRGKQDREEISPFFDVPPSFADGGDLLFFETPNGITSAFPGDWIVRDGEGSCHLLGERDFLLPGEDGVWLWGRSG